MATSRLSATASNPTLARDAPTEGAHHFAMPLLS